MHTFLLTDIEGSTRIWEEDPKAMAAALARHDAILSSAITGAGGTLIKTTGDGMLARFDSAPAGLAAVIDAQRALLAEPWGTAAPLRVRMGVHTGESEDRDADHFGPTMNRTARIMAAGHGGQVLISGAAAALMDRQFPPGIGLRDLGVHRLKDLTLPEHLFQLVHPDLESEFPSPLTLDSRPHNLPFQSTEFFGRTAEISTAVAMLRSPGTKLLTLTGPGGAGKTRLALQLAAELLEDFRDGAFFVDLSTERDPTAAYESIVRGLNLGVARDRDPLETLMARLRDMEMLLVLDNLEQVTAAGVGISELVSRAPGLKVIATSRETLRVRAEHVFPVPPLELPDPDRAFQEIAAAEAVQLFVERATAVQPDFAVTVANAPIIAEICLRLDGLPLAIELAAARLKVFSPADLLNRLRKRLDVLGAGGRDAPDRQRTLWGAIGWSYELLEPAERDVFELLSVFSPSRLESIEAVAGAVGRSDVIEPLAALVDKSLIRSAEIGGSQRFSMLLTIKQYAESQLAQDPHREQAVRGAHASYFSGHAQALKVRLGGAERESALADLEEEIGNLRTAWRYWVSQDDLQQLVVLIEVLWTLHDAKGWYRAAIELASDALEVLGRAEPSEELADEELALRTSLARAVMAVQGYGPEVEEAFKQVLELAAASGRPIAHSSVLRALATYYLNRTENALSAEIGRQLIELGAREGDRSVEAEGHYVFGISQAFSGDLDTGLPHLDRAIALNNPRRSMSNRFRLGPDTGVVARIASGLVLWYAGEIGRGIERVAGGLDFAREIEHPYSIAYALYHNGFLALSRGRYSDVITWADELGALAAERDFPLWSTLATVLQGVAKSALGEPEEGVRLTEAGIELYRGLSTPPVFWPLILGLRASVHASAGDPARALQLIDEAVGEQNAPGGVDPSLLVLKGDFLARLAEPVGAETAYRQAVGTASATGQRMTELRARTRLVALRRSTGSTPDGSEELAALLATFTGGFGEADLIAASRLVGGLPHPGG